MESIILHNIRKYKIPVKYKKILTQFTLELLSLYNTRILLILPSGSCARGDVYENWSDIDLIICLNTYNYADICNIIQLTSKYCIKIGVNIYSKLEMNKLIIDGKTKLFLYYAQEKLIPILMKEESFEIPHINFQKILENDRVVLPGQIHSLKRTDIDNEDSKTLLKKTNLIMKLMLKDKNISPLGYKNVFDYFQLIYDIDLIDIEDIIKKYNYYDLVIKEFVFYFIDNLNIFIEKYTEGLHK